jgi:hypothetical protein
MCSCSQVPLPQVGTALPAATESIGTFLQPGTRQTVDVVRETDELKKARLAWIMGRRSHYSQADDFLVQIGNQFGPEFPEAVWPRGERNMHWDAGKGVNRSSRLCSTEYLSRLFEVAMRRVAIQLSTRYDSDDMGGQPKDGHTFFPNYSGGLLGTVSRPMKMEGVSTTKRVDTSVAGYDPLTSPLAVAYGLQQDVNLGAVAAAAFPYDDASCPMQVPLQRSASMTLTNNIAFDVSSRDFAVDVNPALESQAVRSLDNRHVTDGNCTYPMSDRDFKCGIYTRSLSPFLHGRTLMTGMSATLTESEKGYPRRMPDALGDHVAFAALEQAMTRVGLLDWRPDGVVNSKLENGPDEMV